MDVVFDNISSLIIFTILFLFLYAALLNIYFIHKNGFYVTANCWFCNKNSKVLYKKRNNFECSHCTQYNGFKKNGDYNRVIEAQHNKSLNSFNTTYYKNNGQINPKQSNGLCESCNKNQQLRVLQLASYEPLREDNYEKEIEHFESQLEKTYKLCKTCSKVLKGTIRQQNAWIFGNKLKNLKSPIKKELFAFKANKKSQGNNEGNTFYFNFSVVRFILMLVSVYTLVVLCGFDSFIPKQFLPKISLPYCVMISDIYSYIYNVGLRRLNKLSFLKHVLKTTNVIESSNILHISLLGFFIEVFFTLIEKNCIVFGKLNKLLSWVLLGITSAVKFKSDVSIYTDTLQIFCSCWLIYNYSSTCLSIQSSRPKKIALKRLRKNVETKEFSDDEESSSESLNETATSYRTAYNKHSPITASSLNNSLNKSFESIKSTKTAPLLNSTFTHNGYPARNVELNKHFNELNLGVFEASRPMSCQSYRSLASPNPFLSQNSRPKSPSSMYGYDSVYKNPDRSFSMHVPQHSLFKLQNPNVNSSLTSRMGNSSFMENQPITNFNQTRSISPRSDRFERMSVQSQPYTIANNFNDAGFCGPNQQSTSFVFQNNHTNSTPPKDTASVYSHNGTILQRSPTYSLRSQSGQNATFIQTNQSQLNNTFRPLSPASTTERPSRSLLSPAKLGNIKSFHSDSRENEHLSLSFHAEKVPTANFWPNLNNSHLSQRFVVNSVPDMQCNSPFVGSYMSRNCGKNMTGNSRSSSSSSGFISNSEFNKVQTQSLPNSRDHSPDRNSLLSEPAYHFKMD